MMSSVRAGLLAAAVALAAGAAPLDAQQLGQRPGGRQGPPNRQMLERQVRARIHRVMREQLQLNDEQLGRLDATMRQFEGRRREMLFAERQVRMRLRAAMGGGDAAGVDPAQVDQNAVAQAMDALIALQRRRIDLMEEEQRELAKFLTPLQRARYFALQDNIRRMLEQQAPEGRPGRPEGAPPDDAGFLPPR